MAGACIWWSQVHYLVILACRFSWQAQYLVTVCWSWLVTFRGRWSIWWSWPVTFRGRCNIWWDVANFCLLAGAQNVLFFHTKCGRIARRGTSANGQVADWRVNSGIMLGSFSARPRTVNDVSACFSRFLTFWGVTTFRGRGTIWCCSAQCKWRVMCCDYQT